MKKFIRAVLILLTPFLIMVVVNESMRSRVSGYGYECAGVKTINSDRALNEKCTWNCHRNTDYCIDHHLKLARGYTHLTNQLYFGIIDSLKGSSGRADAHYRWANILVLVLFIPLCIWVLLLQSLSIQDKIRAHQKSKSN